MLKNKLLAIGVALVLGSSVSAEMELDCDAFRSESELVVEICACGKITENAVERLQCFDTAAKRQTLMLLQARARAEMLRRSPGGIEAMRQAIERGPYSETK